MYQWTAVLDVDTDFNEIFFRNLAFPCVNLFKVRKSSDPSVDFEFKSQSSLRYSYTLKDQLLSFKAFVGYDPFFDIPNKEMIFLNSIPLVDHKNIERLRRQGESAFICRYKTKELPDLLRKHLESKDITAITIQGTVEWQLNYDSEQKLDIIRDDLEGSVILHTWQYKVSLVDSSPNKGYAVELNDMDPVMQQHFHPTTYSFKTFHTKKDVLPRAVVLLEPIKQFIYFDHQLIMRSALCDNKNMDINLYPNPTYGDINLQFRNAVPAKYTFKVFNIIGKELWSKEIDVDSTFAIDRFLLPGLQKGIYLYSVRDAEGKTLTSRRLVVVEP